MAYLENYFHFSKTVENLLFKNLTVSSIEGIVGICFGVAFITFLYEAIKSLRHYLVILLMKHRDDPDTSLSDPEEAVNKNIFQWPSRSSRRFARKLKFHCLQTVLHMLQITMGYIIMLVIMSYNAWLIITVIVTSAVCFYFHEFVLSRKTFVVPVESPSVDL